jgi:glycosyltransferase involved in cell wall biosynthesis
MIKIVSCFWNAEDYIEKCIESVMSQDFKDFKMFLIDDMSTDNTVEKIKNKINGDNRFILIINTEKKYKLKNLDDLITDDNYFDNEDIIVELDGDDWFYNSNVLNFINKKYEENKNLWLTNGSFIYSNGSFGFSSPVNYKTVRQDTFLFSHLRTWKAHLWRNINESSFTDENGEYFKAAPDAAYSYPMIEMCGDKHYEFIPEILLVYNEENPHNEHKEKASAGQFEQARVSQIVRNLPKYQKL